MVIPNIISSLEGENSNFIQYEYATYKAVFNDVKIFKVTDREKSDTQNLILIGIKGKQDIDETKYDEYSQYIDMQLNYFKTDKKIVTDDWAPIGN